MRKMSWTIVSVLIFGLLIGSLITLEDLDVKVFTSLDKLYYGWGIFLYSLAFYLAGTEYHNLKQKLKKD